MTNPTGMALKAHAESKAARALRLRQSGLDVETVAERMGVSVRAVYDLLERAQGKRTNRRTVT